MSTRQKKTLTQEVLKLWTIDELAAYSERFLKGETNAHLIKQEWSRRKMEMQHEFNCKLVKYQILAMLISSILGGVVGALIST